MDLTELKALLERIEKGTGTLSAKQEAMEKALADMGNRVRLTEEGMKNLSGRTVSLGASGADVRKFSWIRAIRMMVSKDWENAEFGFEREIMKQAHKRTDRPYMTRDLTSAADTLGGFLVPAEFVADLIPLLRARLVCQALGATVLTGLTGSPVQVPRQTGGATFFWVGEGATITESDQAFGQLTLTPHQGAAITYVSNILLQQGTPDVEALVRDDLAKVTARGIDLAALQGTGANNQPLGIIGTANVAAPSIDAVPSIDDLYNIMYQVELDNADDGALGWAMHSRSWNTLRQIKNANGDYVLTTNPLGNVDGKRGPVKGMLLGAPFATSNQIPINLGGATDESRIYYGNWADLVMAQWGGVELLASQEAGTAFANNQTWIRIVQLIDVGVRHGESFSVCSDVRS